MYNRLVLMIVASLLATAAPSRIFASDALERYIEASAGDNETIDVTTADTFFAGRALSVVEGVWRMSGSEGIFAVVADPGTIFYKLVVVDSPDRDVAPGSVMGACTPVAGKNSYDARIFTNVADGKLTHPKRFTLTVNEDGRLLMVPVTNKLKVNLWRLIPYMFRVSVTRVNDRPKNLDGALRLFPEAQQPPVAPRYL